MSPRSFGTAGPLALLVVAVLTLGASGCGGSDGASGTVASPSATSSTTPADTSQSPPPPVATHLEVTPLRHQLPAPISGEALTATTHGLLIIGGLDQASASTSGVFELNPRSGRTTEAGSLAEPLHDLAAATVGDLTLAFGGGSATTVASSQKIVPEGTSRIVGQLPQPASDLSAIAVGSHAYIVGGYDGTKALGDVLETKDGSGFHQVAALHVPVRYTAVAALDGVLYAFGGEQTDGTDSNAIQSVDLGSGRSSVVGHLPTTLAHASTVTLGGTIFVLGGREDGSAGRSILTFDPATGGVANGGRLPAPLTNSAAATFADSGYLVGGLDANTSAVASALRLTPKP